MTSTIDPLKLALVQYYQENGSFPSTPTANALPAATAAPGDVWYSLGLAFTPTVPGELQQISLDNGGVITLHFAAAGIKTGIDGTYIGITPIAGGTGVQFFYSTSATDTNSINLLKKSFINAGIAAPATLPSLAGTAL
ncbi:pilin [Sideroxydans lithotrophicus]|uniref:pilin n=1 Tax=Sideroxydans lithotrophicus TaxID=63745 RepID=UPI003F8D1FEF